MKPTWIRRNVYIVNDQRGKKSFTQKQKENICSKRLKKKLKSKVLLGKEVQENFRLVNVGLE